MRIELIKIKLPLLKAFKIEFGTFHSLEPVLVKITTDMGITGYGECSSFKFPSYLPDYTAAEWHVLKTMLLPMVKHKQVLDPESFKKMSTLIKGHNFAKSAVECALWDIKAQVEDSSLRHLFNGNKTSIEIGESVGAQESLEATVAKVGEAVAKGFKRIKIKISPGNDLQLVQAIRKKFPFAPIMLDGNSSYTLADIDLFRELDNYNLMMIEQPLGHDDIIDHSFLQKQISTPICLDESIISADDARKAHSIAACKVINVKLGRVGGPLEAIKIHDLTSKNGTKIWCGNMLETGIGRAFSLALASKNNFSLPADFTETASLFTEDIVTDPYTIQNGQVKVPTKSGLGFTVDERKIAKYTVEKVLI